MQIHWGYESENGKNFGVAVTGNVGPRQAQEVCGGQYGHAGEQYTHTGV